MNLIPWELVWVGSSAKQHDQPLITPVGEMQGRQATTNSAVNGDCLGHRDIESRAVAIVRKLVEGTGEMETQPGGTTSARASLPCPRMGIW